MKNIIKNRFHLSLLLLTIIYLVGIVSVMLGHADQLMQLTPFNLLFAMAILLFNAEGIGKTYLNWFILVAIAGFLIEVLGIHTGVIFGSYQYGTALGLKVFEVPLMIGINWALLVFASAAILQDFHIPVWLKSVLAATLMVTYDVLLEPVAIRFNMWNWSDIAVPVQNYFAWWIIAFVMLLGVFNYVKNLSNKIAIYIILIQTLFFIVVILQQGLKIN